MGSRRTTPSPHWKGGCDEGQLVIGDEIELEARLINHNVPGGTREREEWEHAPEQARWASRAGRTWQ